MTSHGILLIVLMLCLFGGILSGMPVGFVLLGVPFVVAVVGAIAGAFDLSFIDAFPSRAFGLLTNPIFVSVPLFIIMGSLLEKSDIAKRMMLTAGALFGKRQGGMAFAIIIVGALLAASTGVIGATIFMLGLIALPAMLKANYSPRLSAGVICASGSLGQIIPPSILLILLTDQISSAYQTGRRSVGDFAPDPVSVGDLFAGALFPGLLLVGLYLVYVFIVSIVSPKSCPPVPHIDAEGFEAQLPVGEIIKALLVPLTLILLVLGSILAGIATPTESAALGAIGALLLVAWDNSNISKWRRVVFAAAVPAAVVLVTVKLLGGPGQGPAFLALAALSASALGLAILVAVYQEAFDGELIEVAASTATLVSMLILIVLGAAMLSLVFRGLGGDHLVTEFLHGLPGGVPTALFVVMLVIFLLGFIIEYIEIIFIVVPVAAPPLMAAGVDPVWFAVLISLNLQMSFLTPPCGYALFYFRAVAPDEITTAQIYTSVVPFIFIQLLALAIVAAFPQIATWLPDVLYP